MPIIAYSMKQAAQNVQTVVVPNSGHWIQEERAGSSSKVT